MHSYTVLNYFKRGHDVMVGERSDDRVLMRGLTLRVAARVMSMRLIVAVMSRLMWKIVLSVQNPLMYPSGMKMV